MARLRAEVIRRVAKYGPGAFVSSHEALGILTEEYLEVVEAVRLNSPPDVDEEMIHTAVVAVFTWASRQAGGMQW